METNSNKQGGNIAPLVPLPAPKTSQYKYLHRNFIGGMAVDAQYLYTSSEDGGLAAWHRDSLQLAYRLEQAGKPINYIALSSDGQFMASGDDAYCINIYKRNLEGIFEKFRKIEAHSGYVSKVAFVGERLVSISKDATVRVWDFQAGKLLHTLKGHGEWVYALAVEPSRHLAITSSLNSKLKLWDIKKGILLDTFLEGSELSYVSGYSIGGANYSQKGNKEAPNDILWAGDKVFSVAEDLVAWDANTWEMCWRCDTANRFKVKRMAFLPSENIVITAGERIEGWCAETGELVFSCIAHEGEELYSCVLWGEETLYTGDKNGRVKVWAVKDLLRKGVEMQHMTYVQYLQYHPEAQKLVSSSYDGTVIIYDQTARPLVQLALGGTNCPKILPIDRPNCVWVLTGGKMQCLNLETKQIEYAFLLDNKSSQPDQLLELSADKWLSFELSYRPRIIDSAKGKVTILDLNYTFRGYAQSGNRCLIMTYPTEPLDVKYPSAPASLRPPILKAMSGSEGRPISDEESPLVLYDAKKPYSLTEFWLPNHIKAQKTKDKVYPLQIIHFDGKSAVIEYANLGIVVWNIRAKKFSLLFSVGEEYLRFAYIAQNKLYLCGASNTLKIYHARSFRLEEERAILPAGEEFGRCELNASKTFLYFTTKSNPRLLQVYNLRTFQIDSEAQLPQPPCKFAETDDRLWIGTNAGEVFAFSKQ